MIEVKYLATSDDLIARIARCVRDGLRTFTIPTPKIVMRPILWAVLSARAATNLARRVLICEPLFKAACARYGRRVRTGPLLHWVHGCGDIVLGDDIVIDGKCHFLFAARFVDRPSLIIGDHTYIGHDCQFTVGRRITIGRHCLIAAHVSLFDSDGHSTDPAIRMAGLPPPRKVPGRSCWATTSGSGPGR